MSIPPSGMVTFLFTDIEGSTKLAQELPDIRKAMRERQHAVLQSTMDALHGYIFKTIGDSFYVAFHTAGEALGAALQAQTALHA